MQFIVIGRDGVDADAKERRQKARPAHIELSNQLLQEGRLWYGAALNDESGDMIGSMYLVDFPSRDELQGWLDREPYVTHDVWKNVEILPCNVRDPWQFNRAREFFESEK